MANIVRFEPFQDLLSMRREMDRLFDNFFNQPVSSGEGMPLIDLLQTDNDVVVRAAMPGVDAEDLDIQVTGDTLTIRGEIKEEVVEENTKYHMREQRYQSFSRSLMLPVTVQADKANAEMKNGVLTLTLPKAEESKPKSITVKAK